MKLPISFLKEYVEIKDSNKGLVDRLTMTGTEAQLLGDDLIEIDILPNRGDLLSVIGLAREISAIYKKPLKLPEASFGESSEKIKDQIKVEVLDSHLCPRYMCRLIKNVVISDSPAWLKEKLEKCGIRSVNNVVDITNYVLLEMGQPLHAFDLKKINGSLKIRRAKSGEKIKLLDGEEKSLKKEHLVIADATHSLALAGVMGGEESAVSETTTDILLESAFFDPYLINQVMREVGVRTESSIRFSRGVSFAGVALALDRATALIVDIAQGDPLLGVIDIKKEEPVKKEIRLNPKKVTQVLGKEIEKEEMRAILLGLGFEVVKDFLVKVPFHRAFDISREIDLIEEIARIYGYDKFETLILADKVLKSSHDHLSDFSNQIRANLVSQGLNEVNTFTILPAQEEGLRIANPLTEDLSVMRREIKTSLLKVLQHNLNRQIKEVKIFEIGKVYREAEETYLAGLITEEEGFLKLKGILENLFDYLKLEIDFLPVKEDLLRALISDFGVLESLDNFSVPVFYFELRLDSLIKHQKKIYYEKISKFPFVERDVAMFIAPNLSHQEIVSLIKEVGGDLLHKVTLFDQYQNSRAYRIVYQDPQKTLTDLEVNTLHAKVLQALENKFQVKIRK